MQNICNKAPGRRQTGWPGAGRQAPRGALGAEVRLKDAPGRRRLRGVTDTDRGKQGSPPPPSPQQLQAEIAEARANLTTTLEQLREETRPAALAQRGVSAVKGFFTDEYGGIRPERVAMAAGVVVTLVVFRGWRRRRRHCHCH